MRAEPRSPRLRHVVGIAVLPIIFILPIVVVLLLRLSAAHASEAIEESADTVISETHVVSENIFGAQAALRGYQLTHDAAFRQSFSSKTRRVEAALASIRSEASGDPAMTQRVATLSQHVGGWLQYAGGVMSSTDAPRDGALVSVAEEKQMSLVARDAAAILAAASAERGTIISRAEDSIRSTLFIVVTCALLAALATGFSVRRVLVLTECEQQAARERARLEDARRRTAELERENVRIRSADKSKSDYLATMSHELRTPLTAMLGFSEIIRDGKVGPITAEQGECLDHILKSGRHLVELVGSVLDLAKAEAGKLDVAAVVTDPRLPARDVVDGMRELAMRKSIRLDLDVSGAPQQAIIDPARLRQILYNYLSNAIKFTPRGGSIAVRILAEGREGFRVEVSDSGIGIDAADAGSLFKEFQQIDLSARGAQMGTGLGLAVTKRITEAMGGHVGVTSALGKGSTFFAAFPQAVAAAVPDAARAEAGVA